jgi:hypothetical protein
MNIGIPIDVKGRQISFRPTESSDILSGEVVDVYFKYGEDPRYPKGSKGYKNGIRKLFKKISVLLPDGRVLNMPAEQEDVKDFRMMALNQKEDYGW